MNTHDADLGWLREEINRHPPLALERERELIVQAQAGNRKAADMLIKSNLRFVIKIAREYDKKGIPLNVLVDEGVLGMHEALKRYDGEKGSRFVLYAVWWIRNHIRNLIAGQTMTYRIPVKKMDMESKVREAWSIFEQKNGRKPSIFELAEKLGVKESEILDIIRIYSDYSALYAEREGQQSRFRLPIEDLEDLKAGDLAIKRLVKIEIDGMLKALDKKEADILALYFGISQERRYTLEEIGEMYDISRERVRQLREKALQKLRENTNFKKLEIFTSWMNDAQVD